jgi:hypothetical protein
MKKFNSVLWIDCSCGHTGIFDGFIVKTRQSKCVGCRLCGNYRLITIPECVEENEKMSWGYFHKEPLKVNLKIFSEIK